MAWMVPNFSMSVVFGISPFVWPALSTTTTFDTMSSMDSDTDAPVRFIFITDEEVLHYMVIGTDHIQFPSVM